jgi:hypothetical protein
MAKREHALRTRRGSIARGRAQKLEQVSRSLAVRGSAVRSGAVWNAISEKASRMGVASATDAMAASRALTICGHLCHPDHRGPDRRVYAIGDVIGSTFSTPRRPSEIRRS